MKRSIAGKVGMITLHTHHMCYGETNNKLLIEIISQMTCIKLFARISSNKADLLTHIQLGAMTA